jgi:hypothetical protein
MLSHLILAQGTYNPPAGFNDFISGAFFSVAFVTACVVLWKQVFPSKQTTIVAPSPMIVAPAVEYATKIEVQAIQAELNKNVTAIKSDVKAIKEAGEKRGNQIQDRISEIALDLTRALGKVEGQLQRIDSR